MISHQRFDWYRNENKISQEGTMRKAKCWEGAAAPDMNPLAGGMWTGEGGSRGEAAVDTGYLGLQEAVI